MSSMDVIKQIKEAEKKAQEIRDQAVLEARNIVSKAQQEAEELAGQLLKETLDKGKGLMVEAQAQAAKEIEALKEENKAKYQNLGPKLRAILMKRFICARKDCRTMAN